MADYTKPLKFMADRITALKTENARLCEENKRLSKGVVSGILPDLLTDDEASLLVDFVQHLRKRAGQKDGAQ